MAKAKKSKPAASKALADPTQLEPFQEKDAESTTGTVKPGDHVLQVVIETPKGSRNKYSFDEEQKIFVLKAALPAGMVFPYDFGFVPRTRAGDGDPIDVLVLMDEPAFPGCALLTRLIGVIEGEQTTPKTPSVRNDRLIAVAETTHVYSNFRRMKDVPKKTIREIEEFFVNYHKLQGKKFKLLGVHGEKRARRLIEAAKKSA
jgi:inorganic pyrophosphatase